MNDKYESIIEFGENKKHTEEEEEMKNVVK